MMRESISPVMERKKLICNKFSTEAKRMVYNKETGGSDPKAAAAKRLCSECEYCPGKYQIYLGSR